MNDMQEKAKQIIFEAQNLKYNDAVLLIAERLKLIRIQGEKAGIEEARQSISQLAR